MSVRIGENKKTWFRSDRFLHINDKWYFITREETQEGPFDTRQEAERELSYYIGRQNHFTVLNKQA